MNRRHLPVSLGNFSVIDSELSQMRQRFSDEIMRLDNEMDRIMSEMRIPSGTNPLYHNESESITDDGNGKQLKLTFDVSQYRPEEVSVETTDEKIVVRAKHEEKSANKNVFMEYHRERSLPPGTNQEAINISISNDGVLVATVPYVNNRLGAATKSAVRN